jgi:hypothetical protein
LRTNGMRHAQLLNASPPKKVRAAMMTMSDSTMPRVGDVCSPAGIVAAALVRDALGDVGDGPAILAVQANAVDHPQSEQK